jgi:hypothetical protein
MVELKRTTELFKMFTRSGILGYPRHTEVRRKRRCGVLRHVGACSPRLLFSALFT